MTISSAISRVTYPGEDSTGPFSFTFKVFQVADLLVTLIAADGSESALSYPGAYSVSGVGRNAGGAVTLTDALVTGTSLRIERVLELTQTLDIANQGAGPAFPSAVESAFDRSIMVDQQQQIVLDRSLRAPLGDDALITLPSAADRASKALFFDSDGQPTASPGELTGVAVSSFMEPVVQASNGNTALDALTWTASGAGAIARPVSEILDDAVRVLDFIPDNIRGDVIAGTYLGDTTEYLQAAIDTGRAVDFQGHTYYAHTLTQDTAFQTLMSSAGMARVIKNANGDLFTSSADDLHCENIDMRGDDSTPLFTGHNWVLTGDNPVLRNCAGQWAYGRSVKATGGHVQIWGEGGIYQTADASGTGYDIEIGLDNGHSLYNQLHGIITSQSTGGILLVDTGETHIVGGQFGKLTIHKASGPAGSGGGHTIGCRILGPVTVELSGAILDNNSFGSSAHITFAAATSDCKLGPSNTYANGVTVTNNGNVNNYIARQVSTGGVLQVLYGDDASAALMEMNAGSGRFTFPKIIVPNNTGGYRLFSSAAADGGGLSMSSGNNLYLLNDVAGGSLGLGATTTGRIQLLINAVEQAYVTSTGLHMGKLDVLDGSGAILWTVRDASAGTFAVLDAVSGKGALLQYNNNAVARWEIGYNNDTESGANAGSNFNINARADNGSAIGQALVIRRSDMRTTFGGETTMPTSRNLGGEAGAAKTLRELTKTVTAIADATATAVFTVTVPNAAHSASIEVELTGSLGAGGAIGANEATGTVKYLIAVARTAGVNAVATISSAYGTAAANVAGAATVTVAGDLSAISGAVGATNTFTVRVTITKGSGSSAAHTCVGSVRVLNANASGLTVT